MASTTFRGSTFSDEVSYALKQLKMSHVCLKPEQLSSMEAIYDGRDVFMRHTRTGYGKSLCFQALPFSWASSGGLVLILYKAYKLDYCLDKPSVKRRPQAFTRSLFDRVLPLTSLSNPAPKCN